MNVSFEQYLILRKLYKIYPKSLQLNTDDKNFKMLLDMKLIDSVESVSNTLNMEFYNIPFYEPNGISTITKEGISVYNLYMDRYINRIGVIVSLIVSLISLYRTF